jgi:hypothetical protein
VVGYFGDADGDAKLTTYDVQKVARIVSGFDTGLAAWSQIAPTLVADINGDGRMTAIDTSWLLGKVRGQARPEIPDIPLDIVVQRGGPDPLVDMPRNLAARVGETVTVPVRLDNTEFLDSAAPVAPPRTEVRTEEEWRRTAWARDLASRLTPRADPGNARGESTLANVLRPTSGRPR